MSENEEVYFEDAMSYQGGGGDAQDFKTLVLAQMSRCNMNGSCEMRGGYYEKIQKKDALVMRYVPDARSTFISTVKTLYDLLASRFSEDDKSSDGVEPQIISEYKEWKKEFRELERSYEQEMGNADAKEKEHLKNSQKTSMVEHYRKLYMLLAGFCARQDYFGEVRGRGR